MNYEARMFGGEERLALAGEGEKQSRRKWWIIAGVVALVVIVAAYFAFSTLDLATDSLDFGDVAQGSVPWPLWIPQMLCGIGGALFALCLVDDLVVHLSGGMPSYRRAAEASALERAGEEL